jgi:hypothetical protein
MGYARNVVAFPFYVLALVFHLLTALFTAIAQKIAGDESEPSRRDNAVSLASMAVLAITAATAWAATRPSLVDWSRLIPQQPSDYRSAKTEFTPDQTGWVKAMIRRTACTFAEKAVRHRLEPMPVGFAPCGDGGAVQTTLDDNMIDVVVSGIAIVGENNERPFTVTLQHYPPSIDEDGFTVMGIGLGGGDILVSQGGT